MVLHRKAIIGLVIIMDGKQRKRALPGILGIESFLFFLIFLFASETD